ncbi:DNA repair protein RAD51 homolog 3-like [Macrobrachium nipponense]|uniref:DNA repair protein RAD51 homolog 3-like n=1 Tax=Macrobrachium nipponense TaxID=159736 RepID=UPI0030C7C945
MDAEKLSEVNNPEGSEAEPLSSLPLPPSVISKLKDEGFIYVADVKGLRPTELHTITGINLKDCLAVVRAVRKDTDVQTVNATPLVVQEENNSPHISTFCRGLDNILGGGFAIGSITELAGSPGIGKTQLCLQACVSVQFPTSLGGLGGESVFIDTEGKFSAVRLKDIAAHAVQRVKTTTNSVDISLGPTVESLLKGIHYYRCYNCLEVLAAVRRVCALQKDCQRIKLLVIDSIAYPFLYDDYESELVGLKSFTTQELQELVNNHNMAVIITNYLTIRGDGYSVDLVGELGEMWGHYPTVRLILRWESGERIASVTKAPHLGNAVAKYEVRVAGIEDIESIAVCNSTGIKKRRIEAPSNSS